jgi:hypothetical protein
MPTRIAVLDADMTTLAFPAIDRVVFACFGSAVRAAYERALG